MELPILIGTYIYIISFNFDFSIFIDYLTGRRNKNLKLFEGFQ